MNSPEARRCHFLTSTASPEPLNQGNGPSCLEGGFNAFSSSLAPASLALRRRLFRQQHPLDRPHSCPRPCRGQPCRRLPALVLTSPQRAPAAVLRPPRADLPALTGLLGEMIISARRQP